MNQLRRLILKSPLVASSFFKNGVISNQNRLIFSLKYPLSSSITRSLVSSTNKISTEFRYKRRESDNDGEFRPKFRENSRNRSDTIRSYREAPSTFDEDFEGAEPVEATGQKSDFSSKDSNGFGEYELPDKLKQRLNKLGYDKPFEIQSATLKHTLSGKDVLGKAFTGSGKTLAFAIPIITRIYNSENKNSKYPKCLVLSPTRELCLQLTKTIQELAPELKCISILGGVGFNEQISSLNRKVDIVCATPGRLRDLMNRRNFVTDDVEIVCLDEADELLTPNFIEQIKDVIEATNKKQMLMFSATINKSVAGLVKKYMKEPVVVDLTRGKKQQIPENIEHFIVRASERNHIQLIQHFLNEFKSERCIIFSQTKRYATTLNYKLNGLGIKTSDLHSDISQFKREIILDKFRKGFFKVLVATDVAARGIDIPEIDLILQLNAPNTVDYYIHRSGRTGRGGRPGKSILIDDGKSRMVPQELRRLIKFKEVSVPNEIYTNSRYTEKSADLGYNGDDENEDDDEKYIRKPRFRNENNFERSNSYHSNRDRPFKKSFKSRNDDFDF